MTSTQLLGIALGFVAGLGAWSIYAALSSQRITLVERISPYLASHESRDPRLGTQPTRSPLAVFAKLFAPWTQTLIRVVTTISSPNAETIRRLERAGRSTTLHQYRLQQVAWATAGLTTGLAVSLLLAIYRNANAFALIILVAAVTIAGVVACESHLSSAVKRRGERIIMEFPTIAELLALAVAAGEPPVAALERVARSSRGALSGELTRVMNDVRAGETLADALQHFGDRLELPIITRFAQGVSVAIERGTPLASVLRAQAQEARDAGHRSLMEVGGQREIYMMIPVVFLVLPISILFAVFPSFTALSVLP
ncbi:type II secretion system F family protein [Jonesia quinghaiensis]|uniref:type II secretion system F family protein n=1 Tax=Jonesia quinghaiensis TaxID=262806 RepID=UPI0003FF0873|nr:type II secretion system F family protein [Jonesia quinghaiensis]